MRIRSFLHGVTPPYLADVARRVRAHRHNQPPSWEYLGTSWVENSSMGWDAQTVADSYAGKLEAFRAAIAAPKPIGVPTEALLGCTPTPYEQNVALGYAYAVARASASRSRLSILDWGGGFGYMALVTRELFPDLQIEFHVKELPRTARAAREHVDSVTFWDDDSCLDREYDLVSACGSLQYTPDWRAHLARLGAAGSFLVLTRTPVALAPTSYVVRQRAYGTSYVGWVFSHAELLAAATSTGLSLQREFLEGWSAPVAGAPARDEHRGFLFSNSAIARGPERPA